MNEHTAHGEGRHAFDFLLGDRKVSNRRLVRRLQGCDEWETFEAWQTNRSLPGGIGNYDDFVAASWRPGYVGLSLRLFNPQTGLWSIHWLDNTTGGMDRSGILLAPVVGRFADGVGIFEGEDTVDGRPVRVRFTWSAVDTARPRWEQAMSGDGGKTWEMNWSMVFAQAARPDGASQAQRKTAPGSLPARRRGQRYPITASDT